MHYNNHCSAGVAHLVERDLAKVEVASSSLVARSKKKHHPNRVVFFCIYRAAGDVLTVMQARQKRRISTTLLSFSEDGARERYFIICYTSSFSLQPLCQWLHRR